MSLVLMWLSHHQWSKIINKKIRELQRVDLWAKLCKWKFYREQSAVLLVAENCTKCYKRGPQKVLLADKNLGLFVPISAQTWLRKGPTVLCIYSAFWRIVRVSPTSDPAWDQTGAAMARSKRLNHYPVLAAYLFHVRCYSTEAESIRFC